MAVSFLRLEYIPILKPLSVPQRPTALAKILGVYRIGYKNSQNNSEKKLDLLVMENLFYGRKMAQVFDLKGSLRNRNVKTESGKESCEVSMALV